MKDINKDKGTNDTQTWKKKMKEKMKQNKKRENNNKKENKNKRKTRIDSPFYDKTKGWTWVAGR